MTYKYLYKNTKEEVKLAVWKKGKEVMQKGKLFDKRVWRSDICGNIMKYTEHGNTESEYGWEIDHIKPSSKGGLDNLNNLQPLYWKNNRRKGDDYPWDCSNL